MSKLKRTFVSFFGPKLQAKRRGAVAIFAALALVLTLGVVVLPTAGVEVQAQEDGQTLNVAKWTGPTTLENVSGRQATIKVGDTYHMWYATNNTTLYHTSSTDPDNFMAGTSVNFTGGTPLEVASVTVCYEDGIYYMIAYETGEGGNQKFAIYTSGDGTEWTYEGPVFDGSAVFTTLPDGGSFLKIDGPYFFKDDTKYRLYFQVKSKGGARYDIYTAESTAASLASIVGNEVTNDFTLGNDRKPVLSPGTDTKWDGKFVMHPMVVKDGDTYYMWYSAHNGSNQQIGFVVGDGYTW